MLFSGFIVAELEKKEKQANTKIEIKSLTPAHLRPAGLLLTC